jgi:integrase
MTQRNLGSWDDFEWCMLNGKLSAFPFLALSRASRRHVAQLLVRLIHLATYPPRLRAASPIPRGWLPKLRKKVNYPILLPAEDAALLRETAIPVNRRLIYGFLHREGLRRGDAERMRWRQIDLAFGTLRIESDKTDHGRMFLLDPGVTAALNAWRTLKGGVGFDDLVFTDAEGKLPDMDHLTAQLRRDLQTAGVTRRELFEAHGNWGRLNVHTLRHSYVTRSLARGVPEDTVRQRTGHLSNELRRYREFANSIAELKLEDLLPLNEAIPELAGVGQNLGEVEKRLALELGNSDENPRLVDLCTR